MKAHASLTHIPRGDLHLGITLHFYAYHHWGDGSVTQRLAAINLNLGRWLLHFGVMSNYPKTLARREMIKDNSSAASPRHE